MALGTVHGPARVCLTTGVHGPVVMLVWLDSRHKLEATYLLYGSAGIDVEYCGHKDDLLAACCVRLR